SSAVGWVLPLARGESGWRTERWKLRRGQLFLLYGDSPIGLRLPLDSITGAAAPAWAEAPDWPDPRRDEPEAREPTEDGGERDTSEDRGARDRARDDEDQRAQ